MAATAGKLKFSREERSALIAEQAEPQIKPLEYKVSLLKALNTYNAEYESKAKVKWARSYAEKLGLKITHVPDSYLSGTIGAMSRLITRNQYVEKQDIEKVAKMLRNLSETYSEKALLKKQKENPTEEKQTPKKKDPLIIADELATDIITDIEESIDILLTESPGFDTIDPNMTIKRYAGNPKALQIAKDHTEKLIAEFEEVKLGKDKQIVEGYSNISKRKLNALLKMIEEFRSNLSTQSAIKKTTRKPRKVKEKPASVLVAKLKFKQEDTELKVKSIHPQKIIGSSQITLFNTKYRKVIVLHAIEGQTLSVKGTTIINIDPEKSVSKTLRKPQEQVKDFVNATKRNTATAFKAIKSTEHKANGRVNEETLILTINN